VTPAACSVTLPGTLLARVLQVAAAIANQLCVLNTNSRYLHHTLTQYTQALLSTLPPELEVSCRLPAYTAGLRAEVTRVTVYSCYFVGCPLLAPHLLTRMQVLYMVNSGSEANDLALRIARAARPGATHVAVMGAAYHGHTGQTRSDWGEAGVWGHVAFIG
jgi:ethanolamine-phosphate phospho-lyase